MKILLNFLIILAYEDAKLNLENYIEIYSKKLKGQNLNQNEFLRVITAKTIGTYYFPQVVEFKEMQNQQARHCEKLASISKLDSLGTVATKPIEFQVKSPVPYINLTTPICYKLNLYNELSGTSFVSKFENRISKLRTGAEDELTQIDSIKKNERVKTNSTVRQHAIESKAESYKKSPESQSIHSHEDKTTAIIDLVPSKHLSEPTEYPAIHIFVWIFLLYYIGFASVMKSLIRIK